MNQSSIKSIENKLSIGVSYLLHPLLIPTYFLLMLFQIHGFTYPFLSLQSQGLILGFIFLATFVFPFLMMLLLKHTRFIKSLQLDNRNERVVPLFLISMVYFFTFYTLQKFNYNGFKIMSLFMMGSTLLVLLTLSINYFTKISIHMMGWGGFTGALVALSFLFGLNLYFLIFLLFILSGITAFSRLTLLKHKPFQIYLGYCLGAIVMLTLFFGFLR